MSRICATLILNGDKFDLLEEHIHDQLSTAKNFFQYFDLVLADLTIQHGSFENTLAALGRGMDTAQSLRSDIAADPAAPMELLQAEVESHVVDDTGVEYV